MSRWNLAWLLAVPAVFALGLTLSYGNVLRPRDQNYQMVRMVVDSLAAVEQHYVEDLDEARMRRLVEDMVHWGLVRLDPNSGYYSPTDYQQFEIQSRGRFTGIGIHITLDGRTGLPQVVSPIVGSPAYRAGVQAGDRILRIDGRRTDNIKWNEVAGRIQGPEGSRVKLTILREGIQETIDIEVERGQVRVPSVLGWSRTAADPTRWTYPVPGHEKAAYIQITEFKSKTADELRSALEKAKGAGADRLVLDLRGNPGGLLDQAVKVADLFLEGGEIVSTRDRNGRGPSFSAREAGTACGWPVAVLIDGNSASASEIVAAALKDHDRATVIGERSYGKGSVQEVFPLPHADGEAAMKLTTRTYWRPSGKNIHRLPGAKPADEWGVKPTDGFEVKMNTAEFDRYLKFRRTWIVVPPRGQGPGAKNPEDDKALSVALDHLKA